MKRLLSIVAVLTVAALCQTAEAHNGFRRNSNVVVRVGSSPVPSNSFFFQQTSRSGFLGRRTNTVTFIGR